MGLFGKKRPHEEMRRLINSALAKFDAKNKEGWGIRENAYRGRGPGEQFISEYDAERSNKVWRQASLELAAKLHEIAALLEKGKI
jgi:hypothetical protein